MADFKDLAGQAKAAHEARIAEQARKSAEERAARSQQVQAAVGQLRAEVIPVLEKAKVQFGESGVEAGIATEFAVENFVSRMPNVRFQFLTPRRADGVQFESPPVFFESDGKTIKAGIGKYGFARSPDRDLGSALPGKIDTLVEKGDQGSDRGLLSRIGRPWGSGVATPAG